MTERIRPSAELHLYLRWELPPLFHIDAVVALDAPLLKLLEEGHIAILAGDPIFVYGQGSAPS